MSKMLTEICRAKSPVALTGAGISAPSGVPTFQGSWKKRPIRDFLGRDYYVDDSIGFFELFCAMEAWCHVEPNAAHEALAAYGVPVITQNIDGLHQKAGSHQVIELHGSLRTVHCRQCGKVIMAETFCNCLRPLYEAGRQAEVDAALHCGCGALLDTDIVLYGDAVRGLAQAQAWLMDCDLLVVIGTSLETYPAAALPDFARRYGAQVIIEDEDCIRALTEQERQ